MPNPIDQFVDVHNVKTRYWQRGDKGSPVVLIHGISCSVLEWRHVFDALAQHHRVYALDLIGHGLSDKPSDCDYDISDFTGHVISFIDQMQLGKLSLVGNSLGARIAMECATTAPEKIAALVLSAPAAVANPTLFEFRLGSVAYIGEVVTAPNMIGTGKIWKTAFADSRLATRELIQEKVALAKMPGTGQAFLKGLRAMINFSGFKPEVLLDTKKKAQMIKAPILVIWGEQDKFLPISHLSVLQKWMPTAKSVRLDDCGHVPMIEKADEFSELCLSFLT
jgi:pimeloyl-ACP methyl ester carboxylesterase